MGLSIRFLAISSCWLLLCGCGQSPWNDPYPSKDKDRNVLYSAFAERPKHLDPARAYNANEYIFIAQIYEPPLQYHYLKRPYTLVPLTARAMPTVTYYDKNNQPVTENAANVAYSVYEIHITPQIYYAPHPAFAKDNQGNYLYHHLNRSALKNKFTLNDFPKTATRELTAEDYVYQIKRLADPVVQSPIVEMMSKYIVGLREYAADLAKLYSDKKSLDIRSTSLAGVTLVDKYTYRIRIQGKYPQFIYWLAMPFFAPMPWEADVFYHQPGMAQHNITLDWYPVGTGPYQLSVNNPNRMMVLIKNPNFHPEYYPTEGDPTDKAHGFLNDAGKRLPFINKVVFTLEKETIPRWAKFLQGYYDRSLISSDNFDAAINMLAGKANLVPALQKKGIHLETSVGSSLFYWGFNMLDPVVGGYNERSRKLRHAIAIALDTEEYLAIFMNGRGIAANGPLAPGIFGFKEGEQSINPYMYNWRNNDLERKSIAEAKRLLQEAGYVDGIDTKTGEPLIIYYDAIVDSSADDKALLSWMVKQFDKLNIQLQIRNTQYNQFQEKMRNGSAQFYFWGWNADYPDPENFLFLLYGPNGKVKQGGENASNYENAEFDSLFHQMELLPNGPERQQIIDHMIEIVRHDSPWVWGFYPKTFLLSHAWMTPQKPNDMANNLLKYARLDPMLRQQQQDKWNQPIVWPVIIVILLPLLSVFGVLFNYWRKKYKPYARRVGEGQDRGKSGDNE